MKKQTRATVQPDKLQQRAIVKLDRLDDVVKKAQKKMRRSRKYPTFYNTSKSTETKLPRSSSPKKFFDCVYCGERFSDRYQIRPHCNEFHEEEKVF